RLAAQLTGQWRHTVKAAEGARHERPNLEGGPRETGRDAAFGHRMGGGIFNRDHPACTSVGKRSGVSPVGSSNPWTAKVLGSRPASDFHHPRRRGDRIYRRGFITLLGGAVTAWPTPADAANRRAHGCAPPACRSSGCSRQPADAVKQFCLLPRRTAVAPAPLR